MSLKLIVLGNPVTKKNSMQIIAAAGRPFLIQSKAYRNYEKDAKKQIRIAHNLPALAGPVQMKCLYWLQTRRKTDLLNLLAATADILEAAGVIEDDVLVESVDGSRKMGVDRDNPRVEITISQLPESP